MEWSAAITAGRLSRYRRTFLGMDRLNTTPASDTKLTAVKNACREFYTHWCSFSNTPFTCEFAGALEDVDALDYLDYEGLHYPVSGLNGAALVWGHVLERQFGMSWSVGDNGELFLTHGEPGHRIIIWPYARVLEAQGRGGTPV